jgi:hypothetical protein
VRLALTLIATVATSLALSAQAQPLLRLQPAEEAAGPPPVTFSVRAPPLSPGLLKSTDLSGWSAVTAGQTLGAPSVVRLGSGQSWLIVRAADGQLYGAPVDAAAPGLIPSGAWRGFSVAAQSEPDCRPVQGAGREQEALCTYLTAGGAAEVALLRFSAGSATRLPLGGSNAGARPSIATSVRGYRAAAAQLPDGSVSLPRDVTATQLAVWDGGTSLFRGEVALTGTGGMGSSSGGVRNALPSGAPTWTKAAVSASPIACDGLQATTCAAAAGAVVVVAPDATLAHGRSDTAPVPGGLPRNVAPAVLATRSGKTVIVVRNALGRLYWTQRSGSGFAPWIDVGGAAKAGTAPSCLATNEAVACFIQGSDGVVYGRSLGTAAGL